MWDPKILLFDFCFFDVQTKNEDKKRVLTSASGGLSKLVENQTEISRNHHTQMPLEIYDKPTTGTNMNKI